MTNRFRVPIAIALTAGLSISLFVGCSSSDSKDATSTTEGEGLKPKVDLGGLSPRSSGDTSSTDDSATSDSVDSDSTDAFDICSGIDATQVGLITSATMTQEEVPGGGCNFEQEDPRAASISFGSVQATSDSDFDAGKSAAIAAAGMTDAVETDPGVGAQSFIATGTLNGGENQQAIAMMQDGDTIVTVIVLQGTGLTADEVQTMANQALSLAEQDL